MTPRLIVFAKAPLPGQAKTRLIPALGPEGAAHLAARMLRHAVQAALASSVAPVELCVTPAPEHPAWRHALPAELRQQLAWSDQGSGDLGARLLRAATRIHAQGEAPILLGTDCPALDAATLRRAAQELAGHDALMIPSTDGGYVLLGLRRFHPLVFRRIPWSTAAVAMRTRRRMAALGWRWAEFPALPDIDEPKDLCWIPPHWRLSVSDHACRFPHSHQSQEPLQYA